MRYLGSFIRFIFIGLGLFVICMAPARAALVTELLGVDINGTSYDVTFHPDSTFYDLWDGDHDGVFEPDDGSVFDGAPTFWRDVVGASRAAGAIIAALGDVDTTSEKWDSFLIPYSDNPASALIQVYYDYNLITYIDVRDFSFAELDRVYAIYPWASFALSPPSPSPVPVPAAVWLFGTALVGLIGFGKRKSRITA